LARKPGVIPVMPHKADEEDRPGRAARGFDQLMMFTLKLALEMFRGLADEREQIHEYLRRTPRSCNKYIIRMSYDGMQCSCSISSRDVS